MSHSINQQEQQTKQATPVMSVGSWLIVFLVMAIPFVNLIMLIVWAFDKENPNRANYAKATLIFVVIAFIFAFFLGMSFISLLMSTYSV